MIYLKLSFLVIRVYLKMLFSKLHRYQKILKKFVKYEDRKKQLRNIIYFWKIYLQANRQKFW